MKLFSYALAALFIGMFGVVGGAAAQTTAAITISLTDFAFAPSTLNLLAGATYRIHLKNNASKGHSFHAPEFFAASQIAPADQAKVEDGEVDLDPGQAADVTVTPGQPGTYSLDCSHFMHAIFGMHGKIVVQ
jgi:uncharacterized cupredoxin-like copper-binding protein